MGNFSPSLLAIKSLQRFSQASFSVPAGIPSDQDLHCATCGVGIAKHAPMIWLTPNASSFTDWQYLTYPTVFKNGLPVCQACSVLFTGEYLKFQAKASWVLSENGAWNIAKDAERLWFLLTPPEPPYVALIATTMGQHITWRAPVTLDNNMMRIAIGRSSVVINRPRLLAASRMCFDLVARLRAECMDAKGKPVKVTPNHPYVFLDRDMKDSSHGIIRSDFKKWMLDNKLHAEIHELESVGEGELFGLSVLNKAKQEIPTETPLIDKKTSTKKEPSE